MPFLGFVNFQDCVDKQIKAGHSEKSAIAICGSLMHKFEQEKKQKHKEQEKPKK